MQAVNQYPANSLGFYDTYGNVWEYIEDQYNGLPGFHSHYLYEDFSITSFTGLYVMMLVSAKYLPLHCLRPLSCRVGHGPPLEVRDSVSTELDSVDTSSNTWDSV